jgi:hypothetical protein
MSLFPAGEGEIMPCPVRRPDPDPGRPRVQIQGAQSTLRTEEKQHVIGLLRLGGLADFTALSGLGQYIRIDCTRVSAQYDNSSLYDIQTYGSPTA